MNKVYITGYGVICAAGRDIETCLDNMYASVRSPGPSRLKVMAGIASGYPVFEVSDPVIPGESGVFRTNQLLSNALNQALLDSGHCRDYFKNRRTGVVIGTTIGCQLNNESYYMEYRSGQEPDPGPFRTYLDNNPAAFIRRELGLSGPCQTVNNACSSGTDAIMIAASWIRNGVCDAVIAGGADELSRTAFNGFRSLLVTNRNPCTPFDRNRQGLNLGEGAGIVILEALPGRKCHAEIAGYGFSSDAYHPTAPHPQGIGLKQAVLEALKDAVLEPSDVGYINTHGTGTKDNDISEGFVMREIFNSVFFNSTKGYTGHTLGAAGAIEAVFSAAFLERGLVPASIGFSEADPAIGVSPVTENTEIDRKAVISQSLAFGGNNSVLVLTAVK